MRLIPTLSAGLLALASSPVAHAAPVAQAPVVVDPRGVSVPAAALDALLKARPDLRDITWGTPKVVELNRGQKIVKFPQMHQGLRVVQRGAVVRFGRGGGVEHVSATVAKDLPADVTPTVSSVEALRLSGVDTRLAGDIPTVLLTLWPTAEGTKLVWAVQPGIVAGFTDAPVVLIDAKTGEYVLRFNTILSLNKAKAYPSNPVKSPTLIEVTLPIPSGNELKNELVDALNCIDKKTVKNVSGISVHTCDLLRTAKADETTGDFLAEPASDTDPEDDFSEISLFYHTNRAYSLFRSFQSNLNVNGNQPLPAVSNLRIPAGLASGDTSQAGDPNIPLEPFQNAFFSPSNQLFAFVFGINGSAMWFGQGPRKDYSYDGDVVYHEFTHAVVQETLQLSPSPLLDSYGTSYSPGAMNEALADYFSSALTGDPAVGEYASKDFSPNAQAIRNLENDDTCFNSISGEVHQDAKFWAAAFWEVRKSLSASDQEEMDAAVYAAMNSSETGELSYEELANLIVDSIRQGPLGDGVADQLVTALTARGVLERCTRVLEYDGEAMSGPAELQGLWFAPGSQTTGLNRSDYSPGVVQIHQALPFGSIKLSVAFSRVNIGGGGGGPFGGGGTPFRPRLLVRFNESPITFEYGPLEAAEGTEFLEPDASGTEYTAELDVPEGSTDAYVMVVNAGQQDGAYTNVELNVEVDPNAKPPVDAGTPGSGGDALAPAGGCGCSTGAGAFEVAGLALAMAGLLRRRRS